MSSLRASVISGWHCVLVSRAKLWGGFGPGITMGAASVRGAVTARRHLPDNSRPTCRTAKLLRHKKKEPAEFSPQAAEFLLQVLDLTAFEIRCLAAIDSPKKLDLSRIIYDSFIFLKGV